MTGKKINVLITLVDLHFGGISNLTLQTLPSLSKVFNISVVYFGPNENMLDRYVDSGIKVERIKYSGGKDLAIAVKNLRKYVLSNNINIISTNFTTDKLIVSLTRLTTKFKIVGTIHNSFDPTITPILNKTWRFKFEEYFHNKICDKVIGVSEASIKMAIKYRNLSNHNRVVIHSGVPSYSSNPNFGKKNDKVVFMTACRFVEIKGLFRLIETFNDLNSINKNWELWLVGNGPLYNSLKDRVNELGLDNKIIFKGYSSDLNIMFKSADYYVNSSLNEALGVSIIEAMSTGLVVIGSEVGGIPEIINNEENGYLVDFKNEDERINIFLKAIELDQKSYNVLSENSYATYVNKFSIEVYINKISKEFYDLVS